MFALLKEYLAFLREEKKLWMAVIVVALLAISFLVAFTSSAVAPFI